jgi:CBS domain-containing protein
MVENRISAIPIVLDTSLAGLLTTTDMIEHSAGVLAPVRERARRGA